MFQRSAVRMATAGAFLALLVACGDSETTGPDGTSLPVVAPQLDVVEALLTFQGGGGNTTGSNPPYFSLSSVPTSTVEDAAWGKSGIAVNPNGPFAPDMAVDYGDGSGVKRLSVQQSGGGAPLPGGPPPEPATYTFNLGHRYATPGTYTVTVAAETYTDGISTRVETVRVTVTEDLNLYIEDVQIASPVTQLVAVPFSFRARGPGSDPYTVTVSYGTNLIQQSAVAPGGTYSSSYTWTKPGTYTFRAIISNGVRADTVTRAVVVEPAPITLTAFDAEPSGFVGIPWSFSLSAEGLAPDPYTVTVDFGDGTEPAVFETQPGGVVSGEHTWAESGRYMLSLVVANAYTQEELAGEFPVYGPPPSIDDLQMPETLSVGEPSEITFVANDPNGGTEMAYALELFVGGNSAGYKVKMTPTTAGETIHIPIQAPQFTVEIDLVFSLYSLKNGLIMADTVQRRLSIVQTACLAGTYKSGFDCVPAPVGSFVPDDDATEATACPVGTYQDQEGQISCIPAPVGSYVDVIGAAQATYCAAGTYQDQEGQISCIPAPAGSFVSQIGASQATRCEPGTFQALSGQTSCIPAPAGSFVSGAGQTEAQLCAPGTYSDGQGAAACTPAPAGSFVSSAGATQATRCAVGTFQALSGQISCDPAPAGSYVDVTGAAQATLCAPGTYQPTAGSTGCLDAPAGSFVATSGAVHATLCPVGTFQAAAGQTSCDLAPIGTYVDVVGASAATSCPVGSSTVAAGSTSADACVSLGVILVGDVEQAIADGGLVPTGSGNAGVQQMNSWVADLERSVAFLEGSQKQAGCAGVRNALAKADGKPSPKDQVTGPARAAIAAALQRILDESGCGG